MERAVIRPPRPPRAQPWRIIVLAVGGLLAAIVVAGAAMLAITLNVGAVTDRALHNDIVLEDEADDLRVAVLDVRHFQRNVFFGGPSRTGLQEFESAYLRLLERIDSLRSVQIAAAGVAQPDDLLRMAEAYYAEIRPGMDLYVTDRPGFDRAHEAGLARLVELDRAAQAIDRQGEAQASAALRDVEQANDTATLILVMVIAGASTAGLALAWAALRVLGELRVLSAQQQEGRIRLEAALRTKTEFIADASHELRTPLTVLRGNAEVGLALPSAGECGHEDILREIVREAARMSHLVEDLLFLARSDAGQAALEVRETALEPWLADVAARAEILTRERGARLEPELRATTNGRIDPERLEQAVLALVDNAAKFSPAGGAVRLSSRTDGQRLWIAVSDHGPGIPAADLPLIFERFHRGDKTRARRSGGAGLGLSIARTIVEAHDGQISARNHSGGGTEVTIELPLVPPAAVSAGRTPGPPPTSDTATRAGASAGIQVR